MSLRSARWLAIVNALCQRAVEIRGRPICAVKKVLLKTCQQSRVDCFEVLQLIPVTTEFSRRIVLSPKVFL